MFPLLTLSLRKLYNQSCFCTINRFELNKNSFKKEREKDRRTEKREEENEATTPGRVRVAVKRETSVSIPSTITRRCKRIPKRDDHDGDRERKRERKAVPLRRHRRANNNRPRTTLERGTTRFISRREDERWKEHVRDDRVVYYIPPAEKAPAFEIRS